MSQEAQKSTTAASSFIFLHGGSLTLLSVLLEAPKALTWEEALLLRQRISVTFSQQHDTWCYTRTVIDCLCIGFTILFICCLLTCTLCTRNREVYRRLYSVGRCSMRRSDFIVRRPLWPITLCVQRYYERCWMTSCCLPLWSTRLH